MTRDAEAVDCLIVGGGPAGLTAAIYAARFRLKTVVIDAGASRASLIPCTRNHAGFPDGISGVDLLHRMRDQAIRWGAEMRRGKVSNLDLSAGGFSASLLDDAALRAKAVILATGVVNHRPDMPNTLHDQALASGLIRYCPVCDGFEVTDQQVGVIGAGARAVKEATFLRAYTDRVTVVSPHADTGFTPDEIEALRRIHVEIVTGPPVDFRVEGGRLSFLAQSRRWAFDTIYPALGSTVHSDLARRLGVALTDEGCVKVDAHQRTSVPGLYAAGDVVIGLDQMSHAMGEAGVAATTLRNDLAAAKPLLR